MNTIQESLQSLNTELESLPYLRKCRVCGLKAWTQEDLKLFKKCERGKHGHDTICKKDEKRISIRTRRKEKFIKIFKAESTDGIIRCHFCGEEVFKLYGKERDSLVIHSLDDNHYNYNPENKAPAHNRCHGIYNGTGKKPTPETIMKLTKSRLGSKNHNWKGDKASDHAKYQRERRRKKRERHMVQETI